MEVLAKERDGNGRVVCGVDGKPKETFVNAFELKTQTVPLVCPKHGRVECTVAVFNGSPMNPVCPKCEEEAEAEYQRELEERRREAEERERIERLKEMNIEKEYWGKTLDDYKPQVDFQVQAKAAVAHLIERRQGKVLLLGANGTGKTHLGAVAVMALGGKMLTMYEITTMIRQSYSPLAKRSELEIVNELASLPMLFIDEMGRTKGSAAELNWLSYILDKRHTRGLPFMLSTNSHLSRNCPHGKDGCPQCFENFLGNDILSRLGQDSQIITMHDAPDYRRFGKKIEGILYERHQQGCTDWAAHARPEHGRPAGIRIHAEQTGAGEHQRGGESQQEAG